MPDDANHALKTKSRRGRKQKIGTARSDFTLEDARARALELQARYAAEDAARRREARARGEILAKGGHSPLRRALRDILQDPEFKPFFGPIDAVTLQNQLSLRKKVRDWNAPDCPVEQEMLSGMSGLGHNIIIAARSFRSADLYAGIIVLGLVGYATNATLEHMEQYVLRWRSRPNKSRRTASLREPAASSAAEQ